MNDIQADEIEEPKKTDGLRNISLQMHKINQGTVWWEVLETCNDPIYLKLFSKLPHADCTNNLVLYAFSDKLFPETLSIFTASG